VPHRIDLASRAGEWAARAGVDRVHVVLDDPRLVGRLVGRRRGATVPPLSADAVELARRTAPVVGTLVTPERRTALMWHRLRPVLASHPGPPLQIPRRHRPWLVESTVELRRRLTAGDYAVHGVLRDPTEQRGAGAPDSERVLALAIRVLLGPRIGTRSAEEPAERR
jgi:hypothetical protein